MNDLQVADERAVEAQLRALAASEDIERIRATLDLASIEPEEARATFGEPLETEDVPIAGLDVDPVIGPMLIRYCPQRGLVLVRAARIPRAAALYDPSPEALQSGYADAKRVFARCLEQPEYAKRHGWGTYPDRVTLGGQSVDRVAHLNGYAIGIAGGQVVSVERDIEPGPKPRSIPLGGSRSRGQSNVPNFSPPPSLDPLGARNVFRHEGNFLFTKEVKPGALSMPMDLDPPVDRPSTYRGQYEFTPPQADLPHVQEAFDVGGWPRPQGSEGASDAGPGGFLMSEHDEMAELRGKIQRQAAHVDKQDAAILRYKTVIKGLQHRLDGALHELALDRSAQIQARARTERMVAEIEALAAEVDRLTKLRLPKDVRNVISDEELRRRADWAAQQAIIETRDNG